MMQTVLNRLSENLPLSQPEKLLKFLGKSLIISMMASSALLLSRPDPASAQLQIQIGGSETEFHSQLRHSGFDQIRTVKIGLSSSIFEACKGDRKYNIRFKWTGEIVPRVIGSCRIGFSADRMLKRLSRLGYRQISVVDNGSDFTAQACKNRSNFRLRMSKFGDIISEKRLGRCRGDRLEPEAIIIKLENEGYDRAKILDEGRRGYQVEACRQRDKVKLNVKRNGAIASERVIGRCHGYLSEKNIVSALEKRGFDRVQVIEAGKRLIEIHACKNFKKYKLNVNRWGEIRSQDHLGKCSKPFSRTQIIEAMQDNGYSAIVVRRDGNNFIAKGCQDNRVREVKLSRYGELLDRKEMGSCKAPPLNKLADMFEKRGMKNLTFRVEGCQRGKRVVIKMDRYANRLNRKELGSCR